MTKIKTQVSIILAVIFLSGCACYSFKKGESPYNNGFVASRYGRVLPEYTIGKDNSVPDEAVAKERFKRRRIEVEAYYKKMGYIKNRFRQMFIDPPFFMIQAVSGVFYMPSVAINDYKYNHDAAYKEKIDKQEDAEYRAEKERLRVLKEKLNSYIQNDLQKETPAVAPTAEPVKKESLPPEKAKPVVSEEALAPKAVEAPAKEVAAKIPNAVIVAKPLKGVSPLTVQFYGSKSSSPNGRIISYLWDFGDGDTSTKKNPMNTYWSTTYGSRKH
ncbi:MAG: PKD domain-containing protein [Candidatus Omnitrophica bacterium]|nr:PKD domain-containing protein [Candidatus Omnitrophota bacterium]